MPGWTKPLVALTVAVVLAGCADRTKKVEEAQKVRDAEKKKFEVQQEAKKEAASIKVERAKLDPPWSGPDYLEVTTGKPCPEGLWALFPQTPGEGAEKERNQAKRADQAAKVRGATLVAVIPRGHGVEVGKYDAKRKTLAVELDGVMECVDGLGLMSLAWGAKPKPVRPPKAAAGEVVSPQAVWQAKPLKFSLRFDTPGDAKAFNLKQGIGLDARVVFTLGKVQVDKKLTKPPKDPETGARGEAVDWGAGRLIQVQVSGVRLAVDHEKSELLVELKKQ